MTSPQTATPSQRRTYRGSCHCGAVRYEAELDLSAPVSRCNCTICMKISQAGQVVKPSALRLLSGAQSTREYRVGQNPNYRVFCTHCGVNVYAGGNVPELGGDFRSVNVNTLDDVEPTQLTYQYWDGRHDNWQAGPRSQPWPVRS